ncbi:MAG: hypothetical protein Ct9H300mP16_11020 [Pseudomonadota bacterium]|nr:MAG: hypothetical protein Ct9H300mP16_11020 [Pseudomonadota bacterium]
MNFTDKIALVTGGGNGIGRRAHFFLPNTGLQWWSWTKSGAETDTARLITEHGGDALD